MWFLYFFWKLFWFNELVLLSEFFFRWMISLDKGKLSYIKLIVGVVPPVCPCLTQFMPQFGAKMASSRGKREEIPLETPPTDRIYPRRGSSYSRFYPVPLGRCSSYSGIYPVPLDLSFLDGQVPLGTACPYHTRNKKSRGRWPIFTTCYKNDPRSPS